MKSKRVVKNGIFAVEGSWSVDLREKSSVLPILTLLSLRDVPHIYHSSMTKEELMFLCSKWVQKRYLKYPILYLAMHGNRGGLMTFPFKPIPLDELAVKLAGKCRNKVIFMGSCLIFSSKPKVLKSFLDKTSALIICGYGTTVPWVESTAFELLLLTLLQRHRLEGRALRFLTQKIDALAEKFPELQFKYLTKLDIS